LNRPAGLLLNAGCARSDPSTANEVADANFHHVASTQLAVDGEVEQSSIVQPMLTIEMNLIAQALRPERRSTRAGTGMRW
jgi:hypothetical protein